jgi:hypothetical protein
MVVERSGTTMGDDPAAWMIPGAAFLAVIAWFVMSARAQRNRDAHFRALAAHRGATLEVVREHAKRFAVTIDDRTLEVRDQLRGGGASSSASGSQYLTIATALRGRAWDLHSVIIRRRFRSAAGEPFAARFDVADLGLPMPANWLTEDVRTALESVFAPGNSTATVEIDSGELLYRSMASPMAWTAATLDALLTSHVALARAVERARPR